jgi:hypothetical protein
MDSDDIRFESIKKADEAKNAFIEVRDPGRLQSAHLCKACLLILVGRIFWLVSNH